MSAPLPVPPPPPQAPAQPHPPPPALVARRSRAPVRPHAQAASRPIPCMLLPLQPLKRQHVDRQMLLQPRPRRQRRSRWREASRGPVLRPPLLRPPGRREPRALCRLQSLPARHSGHLLRLCRPGRWRARQSPRPRRRQPHPPLRLACNALRQASPHGGTASAQG